MCIGFSGAVDCNRSTPMAHGIDRLDNIHLLSVWSSD
jgi:hypothetical protein